METIDLTVKKGNHDLFTGVAVICLVALIFVPLPAFALDLFLAMSITVSLAILMITLYTKQPLDFSAFPTVLLLTTLLRLALNIASTKLILGHGSEGVQAAGAVIKAFGQLVVGGNFVIGGVIFLILVIINFVVITKGAGRIAEVAARFTLDAMPGKQMAIDADLSAGIITEQDAKRRRSEISRAADFYGSMDGASKFVRGDAMAGIMIMLVNIFGGILIGVWQQNMDIMSALQTYTLLTIGEGLVAQIPAIIISTAAAILVTRSAEENDFGTELAGQFTAYPKAFSITSGVLFAFALVPGFPHFAFLALSGVCFFIARTAEALQKASAGAPAVDEQPMLEDSGEPTVKPLDILELEVGYNLVSLVDASQGGETLERIRALRKQFAQNMGFVVPPIRIHDDLQLKPYEYAISIRGARVGSGEVPRPFLAMDSGFTTGEIDGIRTVEPVFGLPAVWIGEEARDTAQEMGYTVVDNTTVIATHITTIIKRHAHELVGRQELQALLDNLALSSPKVIEDLIPAVLSPGQVLRVIKGLLREGVSIRDLRTILETLADYGTVTRDTDALVELVRQALGRSIVDQYKGDGDILQHLVVERALEDAIYESAQPSDTGTYIAMDPETLRNVLTNLRAMSERILGIGGTPVVVTSPNVRRYFRRLIERVLPEVVVLSYAEIPNSVRTQSVGTVSAHGG